ncbi:substrate-binding domain-containing protein [Loktanella sp. SALINAS62]|uniref:substrate-binding domain-containing protein n=1 Tax=Loktanella sp. SALINAS62 TaxID=2706124 RepID=UPI001B8C715A|nr:substrate-binding domain-containing protein [Loktanella sp. SALINAS62]MBS1301986.1 substrate-binding domain-containing protein [Loktanella sp. SALINAS62]
MSKRRTTIYDLATLADTSPSVVSAVMSGSWKKRRISEKTADRVFKVAEENGYSRNIQASVLRSARSNIVGMILPKYDNRYFGAIAEAFETRAREAGLFPVITCAQRDPDLEIAAARELVSYRVDAIIATGATDPDRITGICKDAGVKSFNLDLPGALAPSVLSDNEDGARTLTDILLDHCAATGRSGPLMFIGGRVADHNTAARIEGFRQAHRDRGLTEATDLILPCGYAPEKAYAALMSLKASTPQAIFVNSTITLEGVIRWLSETDRLMKGELPFVCFDWDPFGALLPGNLAMARQDVPKMMSVVFDLLSEEQNTPSKVLVPCLMERFP